MFIAGCLSLLGYIYCRFMVVRDFFDNFYCRLFAIFYDIYCRLFAIHVMLFIVEWLDIIHCMLFIIARV